MYLINIHTYLSCKTDMFYQSQMNYGIVAIGLAILVIIGVILYLLLRPTSTPPLKSPPLLGNEAAIGNFLTQQINALISSSIIQQIQFKACSVCQPSTLSQINFGGGSPAWFSDQRCLSGLTISGRCIPCTTGYQVGINSVTGLDKLRITAIQPRGLQRVGNTFRYYFDVDVVVSNVTVYYTAAGGCVDAMIGNFNTAFPVPGNITATIIGSYLTGVYDAINQYIIFSTEGIVIGTVIVQARELTGWIRGLDAVLAGFRITSTSLTQVLISTLNGTIGTALRDIMQDGLASLPNISLSVTGLIPPSSTCSQWSPLTACNQQIGCVWDCGISPERCVSSVPTAVPPTIYTNVTFEPSVVYTIDDHVETDPIIITSSGQITSFSLWAYDSRSIATFRLQINDVTVFERQLPLTLIPTQRMLLLPTPIPVQIGDRVVIEADISPPRYIMLRGANQQLAYRLEVSIPWQPPINTNCL